MVVVVYGFPNKYAALQFEWAWQNPHLSRHFKPLQLEKKYSGKQTEKKLPIMLSVVSEMLHFGQWARWPLKIHFTSSIVESKFTQLPKAPPPHVVVSNGLIESLPFTFADNGEEEGSQYFSLMDNMQSDKFQEFLLGEDVDCIVTRKTGFVAKQKRVV
ncbi:hypothetical protein HK096_008777 [Nowakowskiella sp. JEL0078]|nr:hypothetical protein HK096_008777 [Nowakowskiella sp. JEL0078]